MTPQETPTTTVPVEFAVTLGRIEEKVTALSDREARNGERLDKVETRLTNIELNLAANVRPKMPWYTWVAGFGGVALLGLNGYALLQLLAQLATALPM